jgi:hypothetical protein
MNKASDIEDYFKRLPKQFQPSSGKKPAPRAFKEINLAEKTAGDKVSQKKSKSATKTSRAPRPRKSLAPKKHSFKVPESTKGQLLLREASLLDADKFKISAAFVLRAFVELAVNEYMETHKLPKREAMFFSDCLNIPDLPSPLREIDRADTREFRPVSKRSFAT